jgi:hypothetical protein
LAPCSPGRRRAPAPSPTTRQASRCPGGGWPHDRGPHETAPAADPSWDVDLDQRRQYALGTLALSTATQAGLAATLIGLSGPGLGLDWLADYRRSLLGVTVDDVQEQSRAYLAPAKLVTVVVGDSRAIRAGLATLVEVDVP